MSAFDDDVKQEYSDMNNTSIKTLLDISYLFLLHKNVRGKYSFWCSGCAV
jgi:hypothetical protein